MIRTAAVNIIKSRLGNIVGTELDPVIISNMQLVQATVLERGAELPWFLETDSNVEGTNITTTANQEYSDVPSNFLRLNEYIEYPVLRVDSDEDSGYYAVTQMDISKAIGRYTTDSLLDQAGKPIKYDLYGEKFYWRYIPNDAYTIRLFYFKSDQTLDMDIENQWLKYAPDLVIAETCRQTAEDEQLQKLVDKFGMDADKARRRILTETVARREAGAMRTMGDD